jgi:hypothetical protein
MYVANGGILIPVMWRIISSICNVSLLYFHLACIFYGTLLQVHSSLFCRSSLSIHTKCNVRFDIVIRRTAGSQPLGRNHAILFLLPTVSFHIIMIPLSMPGHWLDGFAAQGLTLLSAIIWDASVFRAYFALKHHVYEVLAHQRNELNHAKNTIDSSPLLSAVQRVKVMGWVGIAVLLTIIVCMGVVTALIDVKLVQLVIVAVWMLVFPFLTYTFWVPLPRPRWLGGHPPVGPGTKNHVVRLVSQQKFSSGNGHGHGGHAHRKESAIGNGNGHTNDIAPSPNGTAATAAAAGIGGWNGNGTGTTVRVYGGQKAISATNGGPSKETVITPLPLTHMVLRSPTINDRQLSPSPHSPLVSNDGRDRDRGRRMTSPFLPTSSASPMGSPHSALSVPVPLPPNATLQQQQQIAIGVASAPYLVRNVCDDHSDINGNGNINGVSGDSPLPVSIPLSTLPLPLPLALTSLPTPIA